MTLCANPVCWTTIAPGAIACAKCMAKLTRQHREALALTSRGVRGRSFNPAAYRHNLDLARERWAVEIMQARQRRALLVAGGNPRGGDEDASGHAHPNAPDASFFSNEGELHA